MDNQVVHIRLKDSFYSFNTHCETLKEAMKTYPSCKKRSYIAEWWMGSDEIYDPKKDGTPDDYFRDL